MKKFGLYFGIFCLIIFGSSFMIHLVRDNNFVLFECIASVMGLFISTIYLLEIKKENKEKDK